MDLTEDSATIYMNSHHIDSYIHVRALNDRWVVIEDSTSGAHLHLTKEEAVALVGALMHVTKTIPIGP